MEQEKLQVERIWILLLQPNSLFSIRFRETERSIELNFLHVKNYNTNQHFFNRLSVARDNGQCTVGSLIAIFNPNPIENYMAVFRWLRFLNNICFFSPGFIYLSLSKSIYKKTKLKLLSSTRSSWMSGGCCFKMLNAVGCFSTSKTLITMFSRPLVATLVMKQSWITLLSFSLLFMSYLMVLIELCINSAL